MMRLAGLCLAAAAWFSPADAQGGPPVQHEYATVNGIKLHYVRRGAGPLVLFLHGFPEFWYAWKDQLAEFGRDHLAVAPDLRGFNLSDKPPSPDDYRIGTVVEDIRQLARHLNGGKPFVLVAHDWGGAVAWLFAIRYPELLERLVIINSPHPAIFNELLSRDAGQQRASQYMLLFRSPKAEATLAADGYIRLLALFGRLKEAGKFTDEDAREYVAAWSQPGSLTGGLNYYRASHLGPPVAGARDSVVSGAPETDYHVSVPTLVIWGMKDEALLPQNLVGLERFVTRLTVERIEEGTHWVIHEFPERVNGAIRGFLPRR